MIGRLIDRHRRRHEEEEQQKQQQQQRSAAGAGGPVARRASRPGPSAGLRAAHKRQHSLSGAAMASRVEFAMRARAGLRLVMQKMRPMCNAMGGLKVDR